MAKPLIAKSCSPASRWKNWVPPIAIVLAIIATYWPVFSAGFIWDDDSVLTSNPLIYGPLHLLWFSTCPIDYFPVTYSSFWLEWRLFGFNPLAYHATNVFLHAASCIILWRTFENLKLPAAWLAALLFAIHPVNVESVAWIAERKNVLAMFFYALTGWSFVVFLQTARKRFYVIALVAFLLSLLAKPAAVAFPVFAIAVLWVDHRLKKNPTQTTLKQNVMYILPLLALSLVLGLVTVWFQYHRAIAIDYVPHQELTAKIAGAGAAAWFYVWKAFVPYPNNFVYPMWDLDAHRMAWVLSACIFPIIAIVLWRRRRQQWAYPILFAAVYFVLMLGPVLGFFSIYFQRYSLVADHWQYFALPAITVLLALGLTKLKAQYSIGIVLVAVYASISFIHARTFHDNETLWTDVLRKNPRCWLALNNQGLLKQQSGNVQEALSLFRRSIEIFPNQPDAHNDTALLLLSLGKANEAIAEIRLALEIDPHNVSSHFILALAYHNQGRTDDAIAEYRQSLTARMEFAQAYINLGSLLAAKGQRAEGLTFLYQALTLQPENAAAMMNIGAILNEDGKPTEALSWLKRSIALAPNTPEAHSNLGKCLFALHQEADAQSAFQTALQLDPKQSQARYGLALCLLRSGRAVEAEKLFEEVLRENPNDVDAHFRIATILVTEGQKQAAVEHLRAAVRLKPDWPTALNKLAWELATDKDCKLSDSAQAVRYAQHAVDLTGGNDATCLDTLAAAWARSEVYSKAIEAAERAVQVATNAHQTNLANEIDRRLGLYRKQTPFSETR